MTPAPGNGFGGLDNVSLADRFDARLWKWAQRLAEVVAGLPEANDPERALALLGEAGGIAHLLAGTAGMFGRAALCRVALQVEADLKVISRGDPCMGKDRAAQTIERLLAVLIAPAAKVVSVPTSAA